mgnify:FL=1
MIEANESVLHSSRKRFAYVMFTDPLIVYGRVMTFTKFQAIVLKLIDAFNH